jgi:hypothetical protein
VVEACTLAMRTHPDRLAVIGPAVDVLAHLGQTPEQAQHVRFGVGLQCNLRDLVRCLKGGSGVEDRWGVGALRGVKGLMP